MEAGFVCSAATFLAGAVTLLGWLYFTTGNPDSTRLLKKSALLFAVPVVLIATISLGLWDAFPGTWLFVLLGFWTTALLQECLKAWASRTESDPINRFWLVASFGVWQLMLAKPLFGLRDGAELHGHDRLGILTVVVLLAAPVLMHVVTAAIYAFSRASRPTQLLLAWSLHVAYQASVGTSFAIALTWCVGLLIALAAIWSEATSPRRTQDRTA